MSDVPAQVFGPDRPAAARRAKFELEQARAEVNRRCTGWADYDPPTVRERLRVAELDAAQYWGY